MSPGDKVPPRGALEEAVSLFDELLALAQLPDWRGSHEFIDLRRRRAALEPRLARRRENQTRPRTDTCSACKMTGMLHEEDCPIADAEVRRRNAHLVNKLCTCLRSPISTISTGLGSAPVGGDVIKPGPDCLACAKRRENQAKPRGDKP